MTVSQEKDSPKISSPVSWEKEQKHHSSSAEFTFSMRKDIESDILKNENNLP